MTDHTLTPGSEWLLPVRYMLTSSRHGMEFDTASDTITISFEDCESLIPASRLADLEAEVAAAIRGRPSRPDQGGNGG